MPNLKRRPTSPDLLGSEQAIKRAAQRAHEIALQTNTPCIVRKDGKLVDITKQSVSDIPPGRESRPATDLTKRKTVPILSIFFGIIVRMWHDDHPPPHIHVEYQGFEALVNIRSGEISEGRLPNKAAAIVKEWCLRHQAELLANWEHGQRFEPMERIPGADQDD